MSIRMLFLCCFPLGLALPGCGEPPIEPSDSPNEDTDDRTTWVNYSKDFMGDYCVSCHSPGGQASADFTLYRVVNQPARLNAIRCGVAPDLLDNCEGEHPPAWFPVGDGPKPSDDERWILIDWIRDGAPRI